MHYAYQWQRNGADVPGSTSSIHVLTSSDVGYRLDVVVTASNSRGSGLAASASTPVVTSSSPGGEGPPPPPPPVPTVTSVSPAGGPTSGGTSVSIAGSNFEGTTAVRFGAASAASVVVNSASSITAIAPPGTGTVDVVVSTPGGTSSSGPSDRYAYQGGVPIAFYRGVNSHGVWYWKVSEAEVKREIAEAALLGVNIIRIPVEWGGIESSKGVRGGAMLTRLDLIVNEAAAHGIKIFGTIATTPGWASTNGRWFNAPLDAEESAKPFVRWLAERYGTNMPAVGVWNEPTNEPGGECNWLPPAAKRGACSQATAQERAKYYEQFTKAVYEGGREGNAAIKVAAFEGGAGGDEDEFDKAAIADGIKNYMTAWSIHPYSEGSNPELTCAQYLDSTKCKIERAHEYIEKEGFGSAFPIWNNEWGYSVEDPEAVRAEYVEKAVRMLDTEFPYLEGWAYYELRDTVNEPTSHEENFGLLRYSFEPRLSFAAFVAGMA